MRKVRFTGEQMANFTSRVFRAAMIALLLLCLLETSQAADKGATAHAINNDPLLAHGDSQKTKRLQCSGAHLPAPQSADGMPVVEYSVAAINTTDPVLLALLSGYKVGTPVITYSFYNKTVFPDYYGLTYIEEIPDAVKNNVRQIFPQLQELLNVEFMEVAETASEIGQIRFIGDPYEAYASATYPVEDGMFNASSDVRLSTANLAGVTGNGFGSPPGYYGYMTLIHEIGHALGLKHPFAGTNTLPYNENTSWTVMSYNNGGYVAAAMAYDIKALQYLYGARPNHETDTTYVVGPRLDIYSAEGATHLANVTNRATEHCLWDSGGHDTLDYSSVNSVTGGFLIDMNPTGWLSGSNYTSYNSSFGEANGTYLIYGLTLSEGTWIEDIINSPWNDTIVLNDLANTVKGYAPGTAAGNDTIRDAQPADVLDLGAYLQGNVTSVTDGDDLVLTLGTDGSVRISGYYAGNTMQIVYGANQAPVAADDSGSVVEDSTVLIDVLANDTDAEGDPLTITDVGAAANGTAVIESGSIRYTPNVGFSGTDVFSYTVTDGNGGTASALVSVVVSALPSVPAAPSNLTSAKSGRRDIQLNWVDNSANEAGFVIEVASSLLGPWSTLGTVGANVTSYLDTNVRGIYYYRVYAFNAQGNSPYSNVVGSEPNVAPVTNDDSYTAVIDTVLTVGAPGLLGNDTDGNGDMLQAILVSTTSNGSLMLNSDGSFAYTPSPGFTGTDSFTYKANDIQSDGNLATVTITVLAGGEVPLAPSNLVASPGGKKKINLVWNDNAIDEDGYAVERAVSVGGPWEQITTLSANTTSYTNAGLIGGQTYHYRLRAYNAFGYSAYSNTASAVAP